MLEILVYGAVTSAVYALLAMGFTLVFGVARVLNLAHGSFYALGAYGAYFYGAQLGLSPWAAGLLSIATVAAFGVAVERVFVRPLRRSPLAVLMITLGVSLLVEQLLFLTFGSEARNVPALARENVSVLGVQIGGQRLLTLCVGVLLLAVLWTFMRHTRLGAAILAISQDAEAAQYVGIDSNRIFVLVMALSAALAAAAGVLVSPFLTVQPTMGLLPMIKAFSIVILGGLGSIPGSLLAALVLGYSETLVAYLGSASYTEMVSLVAILVTLVLRPSGLFGARAAV
ncbi:MAG TPA: branched-chain amino acid ABC transporter permease [Myxococcales bacterium]|jgi:branched-chain amino acid transport system permease protein|nr:branched-chain amino acid ABC transporter permease [Myxococcales bacterium]